MKNHFVSRIIYLLLLLSMGSLILIIFIYPSRRHEENNFYYRSKFSDIIEGKVYKPYVYRRLVPITVHMINSLIPKKYKIISSEFVKNNPFTNKILKI